jgi:hypothetical protein
LRTLIFLQSNFPSASIQNYRETAPTYYSGDSVKELKKDFEVLLGRSLTQPYTIKTIFTIEDTFENASETKWGRRICNFICKAVLKINYSPKVDDMILQFTFRRIVALSRNQRT